MSPAHNFLSTLFMTFVFVAGCLVTGQELENERVCANLYGPAENCDPNERDDAAARVDNCKVTLNEASRHEDCLPLVDVVHECEMDLPAAVFCTSDSGGLEQLTRELECNSAMINVATCALDKL